MIRLRALADRRFLELSEIADVRLLADDRRRTQVRERPDLRAVGDLRFRNHAEIVDDDAVAERRVDDADAGVDGAARADARAPFEIDVRMNDGVAADEDVGP